MRVNGCAREPYSVKFEIRSNLHDNMWINNGNIDKTKMSADIKTRNLCSTWGKGGLEMHFKYWTMSDNIKRQKITSEKVKNYVDVQWKKDSYEKLHLSI